MATEQWLVEGAGARFPDGMADPASDGDFVFVDGSWPLPFRERVGEAVALRISPDTGCYEFADPDGTVFWTVVPVAPLTWNWISPFRSPLRPDARDLYSPFRIAREWLLLSPAEFDSRAESAENAEPLVTRHSEKAVKQRFVAGPAAPRVTISARRTPRRPRVLTLHHNTKNHENAISLSSAVVGIDAYDTGGTRLFVLLR